MLAIKSNSMNDLIAENLGKVMITTLILAVVFEPVGALFIRAVTMIYFLF